MLRKWIAKLFRPFREKLVDYSGQRLTELNGQQKLSSGFWKDLLINGQALLGGSSAEFDGVIVVNGDTKAMQAKFSTLDIRGSFEIGSIMAKVKVILLGHGTIQSSHIPRLDVTGRGNITVKACHVGDIFYSSEGGFGSLNLDDTQVTGAVHTTKADRNKVIISGQSKNASFKLQ